MYRYMAKKGKIYRCEVCGNIVEVVHEGPGTLVCCNKPMVELDEKSEDQGLEKHVPVIKRDDNKVVVTVGGVLHPMEDDHYIEMIELIVDGNSYIQYLNPGDKPEVEFCIPEDSKDIYAREYCTLNGLWRS